MNSMVSDHGGKMVSGHRVPQVVVSRPDRRKMRCPVIAYTQCPLGNSNQTG